MKLQSLFAAVAITMPLLAHAGAAPARLQCVSTSKRAPGLTLKGWIPGGEPAFDLTYADAGGELAIGEKSDDRIHLVDRFDRRVFSLVITHHDAWRLVLYGLPSTMKLKRGSHSLHVRFAAVLQEAPRPGNPPLTRPDLLLSEIPMSCTYHWEI